MKIELTEQQLNNLQVFLQRIDLKGHEVGAFAEIMNKLNNPSTDENREK